VKGNVPIYLSIYPIILKYTVGILCVGRASSRAPRPGSWLFISSAVDVNSATPRSRFAQPSMTHNSPVGTDARRRGTAPPVRGSGMTFVASLRIHSVGCVYAGRCVYAPDAAFTHMCLYAGVGAYTQVRAYTHPRVRIRG